MDYVIFLSVLLLQAAIILYPELLNDVLFFRQPRESRMDAERHVPIAAVALLLFTLLFFDSIYKEHPGLFPAPEEATTIYSRYILGAVFAVFGVYLCIRPARTLKRLVPPMRRVALTAIEGNAGLIRFAKVVGIVLVVGGSYWLFRMLGRFDA